MEPVGFREKEEGQGQACPVAGGGPACRPRKGRLGLRSPRAVDCHRAGAASLYTGQPFRRNMQN
eukprot:11130784-Heterocapsa_arctica.AAC.1